MSLLNLKKNNFLFVLYTSIAVFMLYTSVYALRSPVTIGEYNVNSIFGLNFKVVLLGSQIIGYTLSKIVGIRVISGLQSEGRITKILLLLLLAILFLFGFACLKSYFKTVCLFFNGLCLGIIWGVMFSFLEGRKHTDIFCSVLGASYIISPAIARSVGKYIIEMNFSNEYWMPFIVACIFIPVLSISLYMFKKLPDQSGKDISERKVRKPMSVKQCKNAVKEYFCGILLIVIMFTFLSVLRELKNSFSLEIWTELGFEKNYNVYITSEIPVTIIVLILMPLLVLVKKHIKAIEYMHYIVVTGFMVIFLSGYLFMAVLITPYMFMTLLSIGLYMGYIPFNAFLFDRISAIFPVMGNVGFMMYVIDSFGYLNSVYLFIYKNIIYNDVSWLSFVLKSSEIFGVSGAILCILSLNYFKNRYYLKNVKEVKLSLNKLCN